MKIKKRKSESKVAETTEEFDDENITDIDPEEGKRKATEIDKERKREKNRLKRQRKKEKKLNSKPSEESQTVTKNQVIAYLRLWENDRKSWKFKKNSQAWLLKNIYSDTQIEDNDFEILVKYLIGLKGEARSRVIKEAETIIENTEDEIKNSKCKRAREILQLIDTS